MATSLNANVESHKQISKENQQQTDVRFHPSFHEMIQNALIVFKRRNHEQSVNNPTDKLRPDIHAIKSAYTESDNILVFAVFQRRLAITHMIGLIFF